MLTRLPWFLRHMVVNLTGWECPMTLECRHICSRGTLARLSLVRTLTMDGWIKTAWRAFWVGLGASAVLVSQAVLLEIKLEQTRAVLDPRAVASCGAGARRAGPRSAAPAPRARRLPPHPGGAGDLAHPALRDRRERHPLQLIAGPRTSTSNARDLAH